MSQAEGQTKCFAYVRVSGKGQVNGDGFTRQLEAIREYATKNGLEVIKVYRDEGVSGTLEERPALTAMLIDLELNGHGVKTVIVEKVDRLARDLMIQEIIVNGLKKKGFDLISVHEGRDLLDDDPTRKLIRQVMGAIAEYDKSMTVMKLRVARERQRKLHGKCEGRKSYSEVQPEVLRELKRLRRKRKGTGRLSYRLIAETMNEQGMTNLSGQAFTATNVAYLLRMN